MIIVLQRTSEAHVAVNKKVISEIKKGLVLLVGVCKGDDFLDADKAVDKIINLRIFSDQDDRMNLSIKDIAELKNQIEKFNYLGYPLGNSLSLSKYENLRFSDTALYSFSTIYLDEIFKNRNYLLNKISNLGIQSIEKNRVIKDLIIQSATGQII